MKVIPNIKKVTLYTISYSFVMWFLFTYYQLGFSNLTLMMVTFLIIAIAVIRFLLLKQKDINIEHNQLVINGSPVAVSYKCKWLAFIWLDYISYENSPWKNNVTGTLDHYMFSKEQWALLKNLDVDKIAEI